MKIDIPYPVFSSPDEPLLENGYIYIGEPNENPETNPVEIFWDSDYTQPAAQPLRTTAGAIYRAGTPANVFVEQSYSMTIRDKNRVLISTFADSSEFDATSAVLADLANTSDDALGDALVGVKQPATGAVARTQHDKNADFYTLKDFGAVINGVTDDTQAVLNAWSSGEKFIYGPPGDCAVSDSLIIPLSNLHFKGAWRGAFRFVQYGSGSTPTISIDANLSNIVLDGFALARDGTPTLGGDGIFCGYRTSRATFRNILSDNNYRGFRLGTAGLISIIAQCYATNCIDDGFYWNDDLATGGFQWYLQTLLSANNGGNGYHYVTSNVAAEFVTVAPAFNLVSSRNSGHGLIATGTAIRPLNYIRLNGCIFDKDGDDEVVLDTYGKGHTLGNCHYLGAGSLSTGPEFVNPASDVGKGIYLTANNDFVNIFGGVSNSNSEDGIDTSAQICDITGFQSIENGAAESDPTLSGIRHTGGLLNVNGGRSADNLVGIYSTDGSKLSVTGHDISDNATPITITANSAQASIIGCRGANTQIPTGGVAVGQPTGGALTDGTINVATNLYKNNTAYTNP